jgi:hypothetical protein
VTVNLAWMVTIKVEYPARVRISCWEGAWTQRIHMFRSKCLYRLETRDTAGVVGNKHRGQVGCRGSLFWSFSS